MKAAVADKLRDLVKRSYNAIAADFDATRKKEIWPEIRSEAAEIKDGDRVLDAGCGNGRLLEALKDKNLDYLGIDGSEKLIERARLNYPKNRFLVGDLLDLKEVADTNFDYIFCLAVLQHIPGGALRLKALEEMKNKLRPGGKIIISVWNLWNVGGKGKKYRKQLFKNLFLKICGRNPLDNGDLIFPWKNSQGEAVSERYYHAFTGRELKRLATKAGLVVSCLEKDQFNYWLTLIK
ncbi:MAG: class I SAM-dependent methyltransferase [Patescibacteria group bacterium]